MDEKEAILIIDDDEGTRKTLSFILKKKGYEVTTAGTGTEGLAKAKEIKPAIALLDINLPDIEGIRLIAPLREIRGDITVIMITGYASMENAIQSLNEGAAGYVLKPVNIDEILLKINDAIKWQRLVKKKEEAEEALRRSEEKYRNLVETIDDVIFSLDENGTITYISPAIERISGFAPSHITGHLFEEFIFKEDLPAVLKTFESAKQGDIQLFQFRITSSSGEKRWLRSSSSPIYTDGKFSGINGILSDITEHKLAVEALRRSEEKFHDIFDKANDAIEIFEIQDNGMPGRYIDVNEVACRMLHYSKDEMLQHGPLDFDTTDYSVLPGNEIVGKLQTVGHVTFETMHKRKDGVIIPVEIHLHIITLLGKKVGLSIVRDISERKEAERSLKESEEKYRAFFTTSRDCVFITTLDGKWEDFNDAAIRLFGYDSREELMNVPIRDLYADSADRDEHTRHIGEQGYSFEYPIDLKKKDGTIINTLVTSVARKDAAGNIIGFQGTVRDITEKKIIQERIKELLRTQKEQLRIINTSPAVAFLWKAEEEWPVEMVSENITQFGFLVDDFISGKVLYSSIIHPDDLPSVTSEVEYNSTNKIDDFRQTYRIIGKDGLEYWIEDYTHIRRDENGQITNYEAIILNITERKQAEEALKESEHRQATLLAAMPDMMFVISREGIFHDFRVPNHSALLIPPDRIIGINVRDAGFTKESEEKILYHIEEAIRTNTLQQFEYELLLPEGKRQFEARIVSLNDMEILGIVRDITQRKAAEQEIKRSIERFKTVMDSIDAFIYVADMQTFEILFINKYAKDVWGEIEGKVCWKTIQTGQEEPCPFCTNDLLVDANGQPTGVYNWEIQNNINGHWYDCRDSAIRWLDGRLVRLEIATDITGRKEAEEALKKNQILIGQAMDLAHMANWELDIETGIFTFNDRFYALYGTTTESEGGNEMPAEVYAREFLYPDDQPIVAEETKKALEATDPSYVSEVEHRIIRRDGEIRNIIVRIGIIKDEQGRTVRTYGANQDITELKHAEQALLAANKKINLLSSITRHDILNQLMVLLGNMALARESLSEPDKMAEFLGKAEHAAQTIERQITFTRYYQDLGMKAPTWQNIQAAVEEAVNELPVGNVHVKTELEEIEVYADPLFERVFYNLIQNALNYGGDKMTTIHLSASESDTDLVLVCEDDGIGIAPEYRVNLFKRGFGKNTGLGLFLSREILAITGITIEETSKQGEGARFEIAVPKGYYRISDTKSKS